MLSKKMKKLVENNSVIREMFEEGKRLRRIYGNENVFDFSLGNPSVLPPSKVKETIINIVNNVDEFTLHGYMSNSGFEDVREKIASSINNKFETNFNASNIIMTVGAASGLNIVFKAILNPEDEVITIAPYFSEYNNYVQNYDGVIVPIKALEPNFEPDLKELEDKITSKTKAVLINTPNNPTGAVYSENTIKEISKILEQKQIEYETDIYLISDEPYRELVYEEIEVPYVTKYYNNAFVVYSFSKSLSLPGERIGYVVIPNEMKDKEDVIEAVTIANRIIGCVNAPSLMQKVVAECLDEKVNIEAYRKNRDLLYKIVIENGFECTKPQGAFYLFVKSPINDDKEFCKIAKKYNLLFVPASSFGYPGYVRVAYCVSYEMIENSKKAWSDLGKDVKNM